MVEKTWQAKQLLNEIAPLLEKIHAFQLHEFQEDAMG